MEKPLFIESLESHQALVDHILKYKNDDGICRGNIAQLCLDTGRHFTWIYKALKRINVEELCVYQCGIVRGVTEYRVIHESLLQHGVFARIFHMLMDTYEDPAIAKMKDSELMAKYECKLKTVQMYRAYALSGWKTKWLEFMNENPDFVLRLN